MCFVGVTIILTYSQLFKLIIVSVLLNSLNLKFICRFFGGFHINKHIWKLQFGYFHNFYLHFFSELINTSQTLSNRSVNRTLSLVTSPKSFVSNKYNIWCSIFFIDVVYQDKEIFFSSVALFSFLRLLSMSLFSLSVLLETCQFY